VKTTIKTKRLIIRRPRKSDANDIYNYINKDVVKFLANIPWPYKRKHALEFIEKSKKEWGKKAFRFVIQRGNQVIGTIDLHNYDKKNKAANIGFALNKKYWGQGIMTEASRAIVNFGFKQLKLVKILSIASTKNIGSWKIMKKLGMRKVGILEKEYFSNATKKWNNSYLYEVLKENYKN